MYVVKLRKSGGDKNLYHLVAVKLHNFIADFSGECTKIQRSEKSPNYVRLAMIAMKSPVRKKFSNCVRSAVNAAGSKRGIVRF